VPFVVLLILFVMCACWGSFLNVLAHRLIIGSSLFRKRSHCPSCKHTIAWYDLFPIFSWFILKGSCRNCRKAISMLYPFIELLSAIILTALAFFTPPHYFLAYFLFFSALIVTIRTDLEFMLISRVMTLYLVPLGWLLCGFGFLPLSFGQSILGSLGGYFFLYAVSRIFWFVTRKDGMGQGDLDLLALVGAFTGPVGCWTTLLIGSILGSGIGIAYLLAYKPSEPLKIPFGPFLAIGAMTHVFMSLIY